MSELEYWERRGKAEQVAEDNGLREEVEHLRADVARLRQENERLRALLADGTRSIEHSEDGGWTRIDPADATTWPPLGERVDVYSEIGDVRAMDTLMKDWEADPCAVAYWITQSAFGVNVWSHWRPLPAPPAAKEGDDDGE